jgi:3-hydroxyacyl-[acyl-carrier-protein] dehydratase
MPITMRNALRAIAKPALPDAEKEQAWTKEFVLEPNFIAFSGHFPQYPVLPAIVQLLMAELTVEEGSGQEHSMGELLQAKFLSPIIPKTRVQCCVAAQGAGQWNCTLYANSVLAAKFSWKEGTV